MTNMLDRLLRGVAWGGALAAAGCIADADDETDAAAPVPDRGVAADARASDAAPPDAAIPADAGPALPPLPARDELACYGEVTEGAGECCPSVQCYEPAAGDPCLAIDDERGAKHEVAVALGDDHLGSGQCLCDLSGPYDPVNKAAYTDDAGHCCYVIVIQGCEGRPMIVAGGLRLAAAAARSDWT